MRVSKKIQKKNLQKNVLHNFFLENMQVEDNVVKVELKQLPLYGGCMVLFLQATNPDLLTNYVSTYATNLVYAVLIVAGCAYIQGHQYFQDLFNTHKNDSPHEAEPQEGTEMMNLFDGNIRVVLLMKKQTVIREVHREVLLLGNGLVQLGDEEQPTRGRGRGGGGRGQGRRQQQETTTHNSHSQLDTHVHLRLIVSIVEPDKHHWSYWLSKFGYETRKVERKVWDHTVTL